MEFSEAPTLLMAEVAVDDHRFALLASDVREVLRAAAISPLPGAPPAVAGLLNVRGALLAVYDLRVRAGLSQRPLRVSDHLVVAEAGGRSVVLAVDEVRAFLSVPAADVSEAPVDSTGVAGVARLADGLLVIVDLQRFLTEGEATQLAAAMA
jgi:purine-binding chemotaxis protein CheW